MLCTYEINAVSFFISGTPFRPFILVEKRSQNSCYSPLVNNVSRRGVVTNTLNQHFYAYCDSDLKS